MRHDHGDAEMQEWIEAAKAEPADIGELEVELGNTGAPLPVEGLKQRARFA